MNALNKALGLSLAASIVACLCLAFALIDKLDGSRELQAAADTARLEMAIPAAALTPIPVKVTRLTSAGPMAPIPRSKPPVPAMRGR